MTSRPAEPWAGRPLLDIVSLARRGPGRRDAFTRDEIALLHRTARGAPEVMVKVLRQAASDPKSVANHLAYLSRKGELELETDDGESVKGAEAERELLEDWQLSSSGNRQYFDRRSRCGGQPPRLVHKLMFSMPPGTPPDKVLEAVRNLAREEFALQHRYALVLHTDEPHPHVHVLVKALGEDGRRLNIKKPMLRRWRHDFARHLRALGVAANATDRAARLKPGRSAPDGIYRARQRGVSQLPERPPEALAHHRLATQKRVTEGWRQLAAAVEAVGPPELREAVRDFVQRSHEKPLRDPLRQPVRDSPQRE